MKNSLKGLALIAAILFGNPDAWGATFTVSYQLPTQNCDGTAIGAGEITDLEIYISESTIPAADLPCAADGDPVDDPPQGPGVIVTPADPTLNQIDLDVQPGITYFLRARVRNTAGEWSMLSAQVQRFVPFPRPTAPTITIISI